MNDPLHRHHEVEIMLIQPQFNRNLQVVMKTNHSIVVTLLVSQSGSMVLAVDFVAWNMTNWVWVVQTWLVFKEWFFYLKLWMFHVWRQVFCPKVLVVFQCDNWKRIWKDVLRSYYGMPAAYRVVHWHQDASVHGPSVADIKKCGTQSMECYLHLTKVFMISGENIFMKYSWLIGCLDGWSI